MRTLKLLVVLAPFAAAIACGGGNSNDMPQVPTTDMADAAVPSMDNTMDAGASSMTSMGSSAMDAATTTATDTTSTMVDAAAATTETAMDAAVDAGKGHKGGKKGGKKST